MKKITICIAVLISGLGYSQSSCSTALEATVGLTVVGDPDGDLPAPDCAQETNSADAGAWYKYTAQTGGMTVITSNLPINDSADTRLHLYSGTCGALTCLDFNDDVFFDGEEFKSEIVFTATAGTTYYFAWDNEWNSNGFTFEIALFDCNLTFPIEEDFSRSYQVNSCYSFENVDGDEFSIFHSFIDLDGDGISEGFMTSMPNGETAKNDWMFTPALSLQTGSNYTVTVTYNGIDEDNAANESLEVIWADAASSTAAFQQNVGSWTGIEMTASLEESATSAVTSTSTAFTPPSTGNYFLGFHVFSPAESSFLLIFGYTVTENLATPQFETNTFSVFPNPASNKLTLVENTAIDSVEIYDLLGHKVMSGSFATTTVTIDVTQLAHGTYIVKAFSGANSRTTKFIKS
jgi:hypothetical protein